MPDQQHALVMVTAPTHGLEFQGMSVHTVGCRLVHTPSQLPLVTDVFRNECFCRADQNYAPTLAVRPLA
jgi:hypothetical protein